MPGYIVKRILTAIPLILFAVLMIFVLMRLSPADPAEAYFSAAHIKPSEEMLAAKRAEMGLDRPLLVQYAHAARAMVRFDFGVSYLSGEPVWREVAKRLPATLQLAACALLPTFAVVTVLGYLAAVYKNSWIDTISRGLAYIGASLPQFLLGYLLILAFAIELDLLPVEGKGTVRHVILPAATLSLALIATYTRLFRESMLEQMEQAYMTYAKARGLRRHRILIKYAAKLAVMPVITGLGMNMGRLITGTIVVERVFSWPGLGRFFIESIFNRDLPVIQGYVFFAACLYLAISLLVDMIQMALDPRITLKGRAGSV